MVDLSIVVPVFRTEAYLRICVEGILRQSFRNHELILVDDGLSGSRAGEMCDRFALFDSRVRVVRSGHRGVGEARRAGVLAARGEYVGFVDSDDRVESALFETLLSTARKHRADVVCLDSFVTFPAGRRGPRQAIGPGCYAERDLIEEIYPRMLFDPASGFRAIVPALWLKLFRRTLLQEQVSLLPRNLHHAEDVALCYPALLAARNLVVIDGADAYHYRQRRTSTMRSYIPGYFDQCIAVCEHLQQASDASGRFDLTPQIDGNLVYFAVRSIFNDSLGGLCFANRLMHLRALSQNPRLVEALRSADLTGFYPIYRLFAGLLAGRRYGVILNASLPYRPVTRIIGQVV